MTFQQYLSGLRLEKARRLLLESDKKLLDICLECGFSDGKYLNRLFAKRYGCTPKEYRKGQYKPTSAAEPPARLPTVSIFTARRRACGCWSTWRGRNCALCTAAISENCCASEALK